MFSCKKKGGSLPPTDPPGQQSSVLKLKFKTLIDIGPASTESNNNVVWDQEKVISYGNFQYIGYWSEKNNLTIARRNINNDQAQVVDLGYTRTNTDGHRNICLGISAADGRLHISYDHIVNDLRYRRTVPGFVTNPPAEMSLSDFLPQESMTGFHEKAITYPKFIHMRDGTLLFTWYSRGNDPSREKDGLSCLNRYDARAGSWLHTGIIVDGDIGTGGVFGGEPATSPCYQSPGRIAYFNYIVVDEMNRIHLSWIFREQSEVSTSGNHDLYYAYSDDYGATWKNEDGETIANLSAKNSITINSPGIKVFDIPCSSASLTVNQGAMGVDSKRNPHIIMSSSTKAGTADPEANRNLVHFWRTENGGWQKNYLKDNSVSYPWSPARGTLLIDDHDDLLFYNQSNHLETYVARSSEGWATWLKTTHHSLPRLVASSGHVFDAARLAEKQVLSIPVVSTADNRFKLIEFTL